MQRFDEAIAALALNGAEKGRQDVRLSGFGRVSMPEFEALMQRLRGRSIGLLDLSENGLNGNFVPGIIEMLRRVLRLNISGNNIESEAMQQLCSSLPRFAPRLRSLDLRFNPCSDPNFLASLAKALLGLKYLEDLQVTVRQESTQLADYDRLHRSSRESRQMGRWGSVKSNRPRSASGTRRAPSHSGGIAGSVASRCPKFPVLDELGQGLFRALDQCSRLRVLDLRSSLLSPDAATRLAHFLRLDRLAVLSLADCFLAEALEGILEALFSCRSLIYLNLRLNCLSGSAGIELCRMLDSCVSLTDVDLASNELSDEFGEAFSRVLVSNQIIWQVNLERNPLGARTGASLVQTLQRYNSTLTSLGSAPQSLGEHHLYQIQCYLDANRKGDARFSGLSEDIPLATDFEWRILDEENASDYLPPFV